MKMNRAVSVAVAGALALLSMPIVAHAQPAPAQRSEPPCAVGVQEPCLQQSLAAAVSLGPAAPHAAAVAPVARALTPAELRYHRETTERVHRPLAPSRAAPHAWVLSPAELRYHRETTARVHQATVANATLVVWPLTPAELAYHRATVEQMHSR
jgi:hypothetical protein